MKRSPARAESQNEYESRNHRMSVRFSMELWEKFRDRCNRIGKTPTRVIIELVEQWISEI